MGKIILICENGVGMSVSQFLRIHAEDKDIVRLVEMVPIEVLSGKTLMLHNSSIAPDDILTYPENLNHHNHAKINSLPYHRGSRGRDFLSKQLRTKPYPTQKNRYSRKAR
jgi:hypothetical protein